MEKMRLDLLLLEKGYFETREKARRTIMAGLVFVDQQKIDKPGTKVNIESQIIVKGNVNPYVSRGGLKLEKAIKVFEIKLDGKVCLDIGASTGGFTDCMLQNNAKKVFAIDVGYGQLAWKLRQDDRVIVMERTNIRHVEREDLEELGDFASIDVSFISLKLVLPKVLNLLKDTGEIVALVKPQFEAGKEKVGKKGVVKDLLVHKEVVHNIIDFANTLNLNIINFSYSPIKGPEGNIEYLLYMTKSPVIQSKIKDTHIDECIINSHKELD